MSADRSSMKILRNPLADKAEKICQAERGFSLIELIGVLAIMGILAGMLAPNIVRLIQQERTTNEDKNLEEIARALVEGIKAEGRFPDPNIGALSTNGGWVELAQKYSTFGTNSFLSVFPQSTNLTERRFYMDGELLAYLDGEFKNPEGGWSWSLPTNASLYIVSSSREDYQLACPVGTNLSAAGQVWLKNWVKAYNTNGVIMATNSSIVGNVSGTSTDWQDRGEFLHIKIINARDLLSVIQLEDWHTPLEIASKVNNGGVNFIPTTSSFQTNGITLEWSTNVNNWENTISFLRQPDRNDLTLFSDNFPSANTYKYLYISIKTKQQNTNSSATNTADIYLRLPNTPFFSVGTNNSIPVSYFGQPSSSNLRQDTTNFVVLKGTRLQLRNTNDVAQQEILVSFPQYRLKFKYGSWVQE